MRAEEEKEEKRLADQRARMQRGYDEEQRRQEKVKVRSSSLWWRTLDHSLLLAAERGSSQRACNSETVFFAFSCIGWKTRVWSMNLKRRRKRGWGRNKRLRRRCLTAPGTERRKGSSWVMRYSEPWMSLVCGLQFCWTPLSSNSAHLFAARAISSHSNLAEEADKSRGIQTSLCCEPTFLQDRKSISK